MTFALQTELFFRRKLLETLRQPVWPKGAHGANFHRLREFDRYILIVVL